jgi:ankyrin repeat protein
MRKLLVCLVSAGNSERKIKMKTLITIITVVLLVGCVSTKLQTTDISIQEAAEDGDIKVVKQHLAAGMDVNAKRYGITPLHQAAYWGNKKIAELLIDKDADVNATNNDNETPLDWAVMGGEKSIANLIRKHGGKTRKELEAAELGVLVEVLPDISIHQAAGAAGRKGNIEAVKQHLAAGTDVDARDKQDKTPLQHAAFHGHKEIVELLIAKGADVNAKDNTGMTPLHWVAVIGGKNEIVELLILNGADVNAKTRRGFTPLDEAINYKRTETAALFRKHGAKSGTEDSIHIAARTGNHEAVKQHLAAGVDVNAKDTIGWTPLDLAVVGDQKEAAELLIANGADVNAKNSYGLTPLHRTASYHGRKEFVEVAELLIANGANVNAKDEDGDTPLHYAIKYEQTEIADLLRKHGGKTAKELKAE